MFEQQYLKPKVIAEIGCNHKGDIEIAKNLIQLAKNAGATVAKFQKRNTKELLSKKQYNAPHPNTWNSYGRSYGEHRNFLEFSQKQHAELKQYSENLDIIYSSSVWDTVSAKEIVELNPELIKVGSASNTNFEILKILRDDYKGIVHLSFGMTTHAEEKQIINFFEETDDAKKRLIIYSCTSGYPVPFEDVSMLEIVRLRKEYGNRVNELGFSGHHLGIAIDIAAYTLGANWIERHFTKDRTWKGTDHAASIEFTGLQTLIRNLNVTYKALTYKSKEILDIESVQREKLKL